MTIGFLIAAGAMAWLAQLGPHSSHVGGLLGPLVLAGFGLGMVVAPAINTGTFGVAPQDAGVASATVTVSQQSPLVSPAATTAETRPLTVRATSPSMGDQNRAVT